MIVVNKENKSAPPSPIGSCVSFFNDFLSYPGVRQQYFAGVGLSSGD